MARVTIYIPLRLKLRLMDKAKQANTSMSRELTRLILLVERYL